MPLNSAAHPEPAPLDATAPGASDTTLVSGLAEALEGLVTCDPAQASTRRLRLYDTVDRRLRANGLRLEASDAEAGAERWRLLSASGRVQAEATVAAPPPRFADDLADDGLRRRLDAVAGIRALVPSPQVIVEERHCALRDDRGKIRCRLALRTARVDGAEAWRTALRVVPLKGYRDDAERVAARLAERLDTVPDPDDPVAALAGELHPEPSGMALPAISDLGKPAGEALRPVLLALLDSVEHRGRGVMADIDSEELHDLRVAVRRSRSILSLLKAPDEPELEHARGFFKWLGTVSGRARDLDVHLLALRAHRRSGAPPEPADLEPLGRHLAGEHEAAQAELVRILRSARYRKGVKRWRQALERDDALWRRSEAMHRPVGELAGRRLRKLYRRALEEGSAITVDSPAEALHTLRKTMKKLRYVFEIVRDAYPQQPARTVLRILKELQQVLGDVQDMEVQADALRHFGMAMSERGTAGPATLMAIGALAEALDIRRAEARARFAEAFEPVARPKFGGRLRRLTRTGTGKRA